MTMTGIETTMFEASGRDRGRVQEATPSLLRIEEARRTLASCARLDEVKDIRDKAVAASTYYRYRGISLRIQNDAAEIRLRAERRLGELLRDMPKNEGGSRGRRPHAVPTLTELGVTRNQSSAWQRIAAVSERDFDERIANAKERNRLLTNRVVLGARRPERRRRTQVDGAAVEHRDRSELDLRDPRARSAAVAQALRPLGELYVAWPEHIPCTELAHAVRALLNRIERLDAALGRLPRAGAEESVRSIR